MESEKPQVSMKCRRRKLLEPYEQYWCLVYWCKVLKTKKKDVLIVMGLAYS